MIFAERLGARRLSSNQLRRHGDLRLQQFRNRAAGLGILGSFVEGRLVRARYARRHVQMNLRDRPSRLQLIQAQRGRRFLADQQRPAGEL